MKLERFILTSQQKKGFPCLCYVLWINARIEFAYHCDFCVPKAVQETQLVKEKRLCTQSPKMYEKQFIQNLDHKLLTLLIAEYILSQENKLHLQEYPKHVRENCILCQCPLSRHWLGISALAFEKLLITEHYSVNDRSCASLRPLSLFPIYFPIISICHCQTHHTATLTFHQDSISVEKSNDNECVVWLVSPSPITIVYQLG